MPENNVTLTINEQEVAVPSDFSIMKACDKLDIFVPRLCFLEGIHEESNCRLCVVEVEGQKNLKTSCTYKVQEGMVVKTDTDRVNKAIVKNLQLVSANHVFECWKCPREHNCELLNLLRKYDVENVYGEDPNFKMKERIINNVSDCIELDSGKCILCGRCVSACEKQAGVQVLSFNNRGSHTYVGPALNHDMDDSGCIYCGKCIQACPTAAIKEKDDIAKARFALKDKSKYTVVMAAPAVRAALGEEFGYPIGTDVEGKMYAAMKALKFDDIVDVNYGADLTIMEEGTEFIDRLQNGGVLPLFTSCSPGWINYIEQYFSKYLANLSSCKSPQQMTGTMVKHYYADKIGIKKEDISVISIMPCIAKKAEANRPEMVNDGVKDVDVVLTTREFARLIKREDIDFTKLEDYVPKSPLAEYTGAAPIFGATGGVMEAALRTVTELLEEKATPIDFTDVRGLEGIKEATYKVAGIDVNVAIVHGGVSMKEFLTMLDTTDKQYHFVEFMACTGGCINGGGQPIVSAAVQDKVDVRAERAKVLYNLDAHCEKRKSHFSDAIKKSYEEFLGKPGSHKAHKLLHTSYAARKFYTKK